MRLEPSEHESWIHQLGEHEREVERLRRELHALDFDGDLACHDPASLEQIRWQIDFATAQIMRHQVRMALLSSKIAAVAGSKLVPDSALPAPRNDALAMDRSASP